MVSQNIPLVLKSFSELLNPAHADISEIEESVTMSVNGDGMLNAEISVGEVKGAVKAMKNNKLMERMDCRQKCLKMIVCWIF